MRSRVRDTSAAPGLPGNAFETGSDEEDKGISAHELVAHTVHGAEVYRTSGVAFQFLPKLQDMIVHRARRRVVLISPNFVEQLIAADHSVGVLHSETARS